MPVSLFVSGLGAYSGAVDLRIPDCALVAGPSESGKTSLLSALSLALTGSTPHGAEEDEAIHGERATVEAGVAGVALSWSRRVGGRAIARVNDTNCPSLAAHRAAVGLDPVITQAILWPLRWVDLARSPVRCCRPVNTRSSSRHIARDMALNLDGLLRVTRAMASSTCRWM